MAELTAFGSSIVLSRLITPAEFGHAVVALIGIALGVVVARQGFGFPLVRFQRLEREHLEASAFLSLVVGVVLSCLTFAVVAPLVVDPIFGARTADMVRLASPGWTLSALGTVPLALLQRQMDFRRIVRSDVLALILGAAAAVAGALSGLEGEAIVTGALVSAGAASVLYAMSAPIAVPRLRRAAALEVLRFGGPITLSSLAYTAFRNVDYAVLGARLGPGPLGLYWRAYQVAVEYQDKITGIMQQIGFPLYSRTESMDEMARVRERVARLHATVVIPLLALLIPLAPVAIPLVYGSKWRGAVVPAQILAVAGMTFVLTAGIGPLMSAAGKATHLLVFNSVATVVYGTIIFAVAPYGLKTVCATVIGYQVADMITMYLLIERVLGISFRRLVADALPAFVASAPLVGVAFALRVALEPHAPALVTLVAASAGAGLAYAAALRLLFRDAWADVALLADRLMPRRPGRFAARAASPS